MSKRFTDTQKWDKAWFRRLSPRLKCFWSYLCDRCDIAGLWEPDYEMASLYVGEPVSETDLQALTSDTDSPVRLKTIANGKVFVTRFIEFQYSALIPGVRLHDSVIALLQKNGIEPASFFDPDNPSYNPCQRVKDKDKDKDKDKEGGNAKGGNNSLAEGVLAYLNRVANREFRAVPANTRFIKQRLAEPGVCMDEIKRMLDRQVKLWKGTDMEKYLRPETLFNKTKFASYYDDRNLPVNGTTAVPTKKETVWEKQQRITLMTEELDTIKKRGGGYVCDQDKDRYWLLIAERKKLKTEIKGV